MDNKTNCKSKVIDALRRGTVLSPKLVLMCDGQNKINKEISVKFKVCFWWGQFKSFCTGTNKIIDEVATQGLPSKDEQSCIAKQVELVPTCYPFRRFHPLLPAIEDLVFSWVTGATIQFLVCHVDSKLCQTSTTQLY